MKKINVLILVSFLILGFNLRSVKAAEKTLQELITECENCELVLEKSYTESVSIPKDKNVLLDLNGNSITGAIEVLGKLEVKTSKTGGKVIGISPDLTKESSNLIEVEGELIINSGTFENEYGYGVYGYDEGKVTINDGTFNTKYAILGSNNTTGVVNFEVNGGTLNATYGPAIYLPSPISLTVNDGTLNGGISLRMGVVNIKGGVINAAVSNLDMPEEYYNFGGNAWLPDALYVFGGTYEAFDNKLELNITGGEFNNTNGVGSAVAIYDFGRVEQSMKVNISSKAKLTTNSTTRNAYDVLNLTDLGVTSIKTGYNNPLYIGKIATSITGGSFSSSVLDYLDKFYVETNKNGVYTVSQREFRFNAPEINSNGVFENVTVGVNDIDRFKQILIDSLRESGIDFNDDNVPTFEIEITNDENPSEEILEKIENVLNKIGKNTKIVNVFNIEIFLSNNSEVEVEGLNGNLNIRNSSNNTSNLNDTSLTELTEKIEFVIAIPDEFLNTDENITRTFYIIRNHNGEYEQIPVEIKDNMLYFSSDKFSTYALAYEDKVESSKVENPNTSDNILIFMSLSVLALVGSIKVYKKLHN